MLSQDELSEMHEYVARLASKILLLEDDSTRIFASIIDRDENIGADKSFFYRNVKVMHQDMLDINGGLDECSAKLAKLTALFRGTLKKDKFRKFADALDEIPFEFMITTDLMKKDGKKDSF